MQGLKTCAAAVLAGCLCLAAAGTVQADDRSVTIVASKAQLADMQPLLGDLKDEDVTVKTLDPGDITQAKDDPYVIIVTTMQPGDATAPVIAPLLSESEKKTLSKAGGKKMMLKRDAWKNGQEVIVFAGNTDGDAAAARKASKGTWWETVGVWFDINTSGMHGY